MAETYTEFFDWRHNIIIGGSRNVPESNYNPFDFLIVDSLDNAIEKMLSLMPKQLLSASRKSGSKLGKCNVFTLMSGSEYSNDTPMGH